jgi:hypothetical protein
LIFLQSVVVAVVEPMLVPAVAVAELSIELESL